ILCSHKGLIRCHKYSMFPLRTPKIYVTFTNSSREWCLSYPVLLKIAYNPLKMFYRSQSIANVSIIASFIPEKISLLNKNTEITVKICFQATFRPAKRDNQVAIKCNATLDADLQSSRVTSRGLFKESNERYMQRDVVVTHSMNCVQDIFNVQEPSDAVNSLNVRIDIFLANPGTSPVLDTSSPASVAYSIPFIKDCGEDELCICDLVLNVQQKGDDGKQQFIATFSDNLFFASSSLPVCGTQLHCFCYCCRFSSYSKKNVFFCLLVSVPRKENVSFDISFDFNLKNLQNMAVLSFHALSESKEEQELDNQISLSIPLRYDAEIHFTRLANINFYEVYSGHNIPSTVNNFEDIGPTFNFSVKVTTGSIPVKMASVKIHLPELTSKDNPLMYITAVDTDQARGVTCQVQINPLQIGKRPYSASFKKENLRAVKELVNLSRMRTEDFLVCYLLNKAKKDVFRNWEGVLKHSFTIFVNLLFQSTFQTLQLFAEAEINVHNTDLFIIGENTLTIPVTIIKPDEKAEIPIGVVIGSILAGLLLLLVLVAVLWKFGFFKRQYEKMTQDIEDIDEITELTKYKD
uniref:Integrin subunit alpha 2 n=1 Tax=Meleagris gallopavo TaxID=9103 RepID=G1MXJ3_MELGA